MDKILLPQESVKGSNWISIEESKNTPSPVIKFLIIF